MDSFDVKITGHFDDAETLLEDLFRPGTKPHELLKNALEREFRPNGAPEVKQMNIDRVKYGAATSIGSFRVVLNIDYTFGCEDLLVQKNNEASEWTFTVNGDLISFYSSPYIDSRSTADEF
ncbi:hypothetical protein KXD93_03145 [Mucilaginibacter sp. BJC16-A38]|uniref:hypothetical protein n=1 Tax=Mucilaginibacter phenanthrenivorans TaxID=1234842 RepID=UPI0021576231|nr:hypothetical protein [Mucilaginibacter phenanthrenivorans]MCR8556617.1 hypothetical protein [Mucilaginibacter phenanthrenivorans]